MNDLIHIPPQNIDMETSVLASILIYQPDEPFDILTPDDFYRTAHRRIFEECSRLQSKNESIDIGVIAQALIDANRLEEIGGAGYLAAIMDENPVSHTIEQHCKLLKELSIKRKLILCAHEIASECYEGSGDALDIAQQKIMSINRDHMDSVEPFSKLIEDRIDHYEQIQRNHGVTGIETGYKDLDLLLSGLQNKDLIVLAARPSMGKTALALNICRHAAGQGIGSIIFSLEMGKERLIDRFMAMESQVNSMKFSSGMFDREDWERMMGGASILSDFNIIIDDKPGMHISEIRRKSRRYKKQFGIGFIVIDYLQLVRGDTSMKSRTREIGDISQQCKAIAKELDIPVILISQLSRAVEQRPNKKPILSDLRDSGEIEQDADVVMFIYRDEVYNKDVDNPNKGKAEICIEKHRNGPTGKLFLHFAKRTTRFEPLAEVEGF